jgi:beta-1,2-mannobiose phosphorylase / 1,2-beta-oligomannan phosphorylase
MFTINYPTNGPIISPNRKNSWESVATFNPSPVMHKKKLHVLYRAMGEVDRMVGEQFRMSVIGSAVQSKNGNFEDRTVLVGPTENFDRFGAEDPRVTTIDGTHYIFYTALGGYPFNADNIKVAVAISKDLKKVDEKHIVTPFNAKAMVLFPEKINGEYVAILSINTDRAPSDICIARFKKIEDIWSKKYWDKWYDEYHLHKLNIQRGDRDQVEVGATPFKTKDGWVLIYSHIQQYGTDNPVFGVEALLLDKNNPQNVLSRTDGPFMTPDSHFEKIGLIPNIAFPTGVLLGKRGKVETIEIFYGGADTYCATATIPLKPFLKYLRNNDHLIKRFEGNPILAPRDGDKFNWEAGGVFNPAAVLIKDTTYILYRAVTKENVSTIGLAVSKDGFKIDERLDYPIYKGRESFEVSAKGENANHGTEDARITVIGKKMYITYTAYNGIIPRIAISSIDINDFIARKFDKWSKPYAITPDTIDDKDCCIIPEEIKGKYTVIHRIGEHICADQISSLDNGENLTKCIDMMGPRRGMWDGWKVGVSTTPIKTKAGWMVLYHGVSSERVYSTGAMLLGLKDPTKVLARSAMPVFRPQKDYELNGVVSRVVFPCGITMKGDECRIYYGGADFVTGIATFSMKEMLETLLPVNV